VRRIAERRGVIADTDLVTVRFTQAELEQKQDDIRKKIEDIIEAGRARTSYNSKSNTVVVTALATLPPLEEARVKDLTKISGVTIRRLDVPTLRGKLVACNVTFCNPPFRGGRGIRQAAEITPSNFPFAGCTAAFIARDNTNPSQLWVLTAFSSPACLGRHRTNRIPGAWSVFPLLPVFQAPRAETRARLA
jgi:hypothetical protein